MEILCTENYSLFKFIPGNRIVRTSHTKKLEKSIAENARSIMYSPVIVNDKMQIIDGQHRFEAIKKLGLKVYYVVADGLNIKDVQRFNSTSKTWSPADYAKSYALRKFRPYQFYIELKDNYGFNHDILMRYIALDQPITVEMFKSGMLSSPSEKKTINLCEKLNEVGKFYFKFKKGQYRNFSLAYKQIWESPLYDHKRMMKNLSELKKPIEDIGAQEEFVELLNTIYNS